MNVFQRRAQARNADKFSNSIPIAEAKPELINEIEEEIDEPKKNIFQQHAAKNKQKKEEKFSFLDTAKDIGEQVATKGISGVGGAYGNMLNTFGLQVPKGKEILPGQEQVNIQQSQILDKLNRGETPSFSELMLLSDEDVVPNFTRLPTSKEIQSGIKDVSGIGEGKTPAGRIAGRGAEFLGEGIAMPGGGAKALATLGGAGIAGQSVREAGGSEDLASAVEIGGSIIPSMISGKLVPTSKTAKDTVQAGRKIGLTEKQITPLIQGETKTAVLSKVARKGTKTKERFASIKESLGDSYQNIKNNVANLGNVNARNQQNLIDKFTNIKNDLLKTVKPSPDKESAINFINDSINKISKSGATPEELINFWQDINKSVKWNSIQGGKKSLTRLKEPILEVLNNVAPQAAKDFEMTNKLYSKYAEISKKLKPNLVDSFVNKGEIVSGIPSGLALATGNPMPLLALGGEISTRLLAREMLINPYFQNLANKLVTNFNAGSAKGITTLVNQAKDYMERKHPEEDWSFLTED